MNKEEKYLKYGKKAAIARQGRMKAAKEIGTHTSEEWEALTAAHGNRCVRCFAESKMTKDHIDPVFFGGSDAIDNLQPLCHSCNSSKGAGYFNWLEFNAERPDDFETQKMLRDRLWMAVALAEKRFDDRRKHRYYIERWNRKKAPMFAAHPDWFNKGRLWDYPRSTSYYEKRTP